MSQPVFYDPPTRPAGNTCGACLTSVAVAVSALIIFFRLYRACVTKPLPELLFSPQKRAFKAFKESEKEKARDSPEEGGCTFASQV